MTVQFIKTTNFLEVRIEPDREDDHTYTGNSKSQEALPPCAVSALVSGIFTYMSFLLLFLFFSDNHDSSQDSRRQEPLFKGRRRFKPVNGNY